jgi:serine/threonine-protein kinase
LKGKYAYFSPEQAAGDPLDHRSDIYALGIVAWELLTGRRLFRSETPRDVLERVIGEAPPLVTETTPDVPDELADVVARALRRQPDDRFASAGEMAKALRSCARTLSHRPDAVEIGRFVSEVGGERLAKLQERIRAAAAEGNKAGALPATAREPAANREPTAPLDASAIDGTAGPAPPATSTEPLSTERLRKLARDDSSDDASHDDSSSAADALEASTVVSPVSTDGQTDFGAATHAVAKVPRRGGVLALVALLAIVAGASWAILRGAGGAPATVPSATDSADSSFEPVQSGTDTPPTATDEPPLAGPGSEPAASGAPDTTASASVESPVRPSSPPRQPTRLPSHAPASPRSRAPATATAGTKPKPPAPSSTDELLPIDALE